jgi:hypothetical protein
MEMIKRQNNPTDDWRTVYTAEIHRGQRQKPRRKKDSLMNPLYTRKNTKATDRTAAKSRKDRPQNNLMTINGIKSFTTNSFKQSAEQHIIKSIVNFTQGKI